MVNFRYHLISLTAVFLALGVGLAFGAAFIDKATVSTLDDQITALEKQRDDLRQTNDELRRSLDLSDRLAEDGGLQLLEGQLANVPIVVLATRGTDEELVARTRDAIGVSGAAFGGTLWLTDRLVLDDESERTELADVLGVPVSAAERLQRIFSGRVGGMLASAAREEPPEESAQPDGIPEPNSLVPNVVPEPDLLADLRAAGFVELDAPATAPTHFDVLPAAGARYVFVSGPGAILADEAVMLRLVRRLAIGNPPSTVVAEATHVPLAGDEGDANPATLVPLVRGDEALREVVSTVDGAETYAGRVALVLAVKHFAERQIGHYGVGEGADALVPPPVDE